LNQAFLIFRNRVAAIVKIYFSIIPKLIDDKFAYLYGCSANIVSEGYLSYSISSSCLYTAISTATTIQELATALQCFFIALEATGYPDSFELTDTIKEAIKLSPGIGIKITKQKNSVIFYPTEREYFYYLKAVFAAN
jgi:hypothetical protein